jgi:hypothetical protein
MSIEQTDQPSPEFSTRQVLSTIQQQSIIPTNSPLSSQGSHTNASNGSHNLPGATNTYTSNPCLNTLKIIVVTLQCNPASSMLSSIIGLGGYLLCALAIVLLSVLINPIAGIFGSLLFIITFFTAFGSYYIIALCSARNERISVKQAYAQSGKRLPAYVALTLLYILGVVVGSLLLIPGIIFAARGSLAGVIVFEEQLGPIKALKRSFKLTKGHTFEIIGSFSAAILIGGSGLIFGSVAVAPFVGRYNDLILQENSKGPKIPTHWLNYLGIVVIVVTIGSIAGSVFIDRSLINDSDSSSSNIRTQPSYFNSGGTQSSTNPQVQTFVQ